ncbi:hypothetical protein [Photobacterium damselae]|uniref:hypothetical protein n=1 Tax=Photobacterium damselae TaxID=38293 RepID=UPI001F244FFA|nr:hypothetical protein [Photobacterium damselae]UKA12001.1 hypothetical protein IHC91_19750 [Photobacterium damselae subsp. damselae]
MIIVSEIVGQYPELEKDLVNYECDTVHLEHWESSKSRIKKKTEHGREIAVSLDRGKHLHNNDVLFVDHINKVFITVTMKLKNVLKISLDTNADINTIFKLGHALGNQHWPAVLDNHTIYVPLYVDEKIMRSMLKTHNFKDIDIEFITGEELSTLINTSDLRLIFSGDDTTVHKHH